MVDQELQRPASPGITRRRVVKTGAHAAWAVPVVTVLASAPAFAGNGSPTTALAVKGTSAVRDPNSKLGRSLEVRVTVINDGTVDATGVTATVTIVPAAGGDFSTTTENAQGTKTESGTTATFTYALGTIAAGQSTGELTATFILSPTPSGGTVTITATANEAAQATGQPTPFA